MANLVDVLCIIGIVYCVSVMIFHKFDIEVTNIEEVNSDTYIITVKRLWRTYTYTTDKNMCVWDVDRNIKFKIIKKKENSSVKINRDNDKE